MANTNLQAAKAAKKDEFYTQLTDIEKELRHYKEHFKGKTVLCNCDDPRVSNFFVYFARNFEHLGLKRLITTCYKSQEVDLFSDHTAEQAVYMIYEGDKNHNNAIDPDELDVRPLKGDGDFRSPECIELLKQADIVVTNPPFSLFRFYVPTLLKYEKEFLIIGPQNATHYSEIFPYIQQNKLWHGFTSVKEFIIPGNKKKKFGNVIWYTNLDHNMRHEEMILYRKYVPEDYPIYCNYNAIHIRKIDEIPCDYYGEMGVPDTIIDHFNPEQFEIIGLGSGILGQKIGVGGIPKEHKSLMKGHSAAGDLYYMKNGLPNVPFSRIIIRRKKQDSDGH